MFYCETDRIKNGWPESLARSVGHCEVCGEERVCYDVPSSQLPESLKALFPLNTARDAQRATEGRVRWSHDAKGRVLALREGFVVCPYEQTSGGWYAVVVKATSESDLKSYPRGGYNIVVSDDEIEKAQEVEV